MTIDIADRRLLNLIQAEFPFTREPFAELGRRIGCSVHEVAQQVAALKKEGIIRSIGPVVDARKLGYHSTLVAMRIGNADVEAAERVIAGHPGVSHGYERDHLYNVWFTLALPPAENVDDELARLSDSTGAEASFSLPALKLFKIGAYFDVDETGQGSRVSTTGGSLSGRAEVSDRERLVLNELQQDLPLIPAPFSPMADRVGMDVEHFLEGCRSLLQKGVIRRFSASINHRRAGFVANAMSCWVAPPDKVDVIGNKLAALKEVSHCYERKTNGAWRHNLFAMVHGRSREVCQDIADNISRETGLPEYELLYSTREFKKARIKYLV